MNRPPNSSILLFIDILAFLFIILRIMGYKNSAFQAFAHIFVGMLIVFAYYNRDFRQSIVRLLGALIAIECGMFLVDKLKG